MNLLTTHNQPNPLPEIALHCETGESVLCCTCIAVFVHSRSFVACFVNYKQAIRIICNFQITIAQKKLFFHPLFRIKFSISFML